MSETAHPFLLPATPVLRCPDGSVQVGGVDAADGLIVPPGAAWGTALLTGLDGSRSSRTVVGDAVHTGAEADEVTMLLQALREVGLLVDLESADLLASDAGPAARARTAPELAAAAAGTAGSRWSSRRAAAVVVEGATRVGVPLAAVLAGSGIGRVSVRDSGLATAADAVAGGLSAADEGRARSVAAADAIRRANPLTDLRPPTGSEEADLVVLARPWAASDPLVSGLQRNGVPHLVAAVRGETGVVGPLVVPGRTSCLRCADLHRRDADPRWPLLAAQLTATEPPPSGATTTCLLTAVTAALQVLSYLDGVAAPATLDATLEMRPPDPVPRLRRWPPHPSCPCLDRVPTSEETLPGTPDRGAGTPSGWGSAAARVTMTR